MLDLLFSWKKEYKNILQGKSGMLSVAQIVNGAINLTDAKNSLSPASYQNVLNLYNAYLTQKEKTSYNAESLAKATLEIFLRFDFEADIRKYTRDHPISAMWKTTDELSSIRKDAHFARDMKASSMRLINEISTFISTYEKIPDSQIFIAAEKGKITNQAACEIVRLKKDAASRLQKEKDEFSKYSEQFTKLHEQFMELNCTLNGMPEMIKTVYEEKGIEHYDQIFASKFANYRHPYTNQPIRSVQDYLDVLDSFASKRSIVTDKKLSIQELDQIMENKFGNYGVNLIGRRITCIEDYLRALEIQEKRKHPQ